MTQGYSYQTSLDTFRQGLFARVIALITTFLFVFVFYASPAGAAVANEVNKTEQQEAALDAAIASTPEKALSYRLGQLRDRLLLELPHAIDTREADQNWFESLYNSVLGDGPLTADELDDIRELQTQITQSYDEVIETLQQERVTFEQEADDAGHPLSADVKQLITQRHQQTLNHIQSRYQLTQSRLAALLDEDGDQEAALENLQQSLKPEQFTPTHTPVTPDSLPWGVPDEEVREPLEKPDELLSYLDFNPWGHYPQVAQAGSDPEIDAELLRNALNADVQAGLKPTLETTSNDAITALAATLNHNSVEIYTWVHNNIKFIPSYGSIQGAQHTLETKQGNAIDTASLLIALLRASNIPARYQYGVVELPAEKVMNWVGGAKTPEAAQAILGMGGVPVVGVVEAGKIAKFKMEHVWVEAYVDYASFKQYEFTEGMNLKEQVPFNAEALANTIKSKAVINEAEGWVMNVPQADIEAQLTQFQNQLKAHIENQNPDSTVGEVLGLQEIKILPARPLAAGLPYNRLITSQTFYEVPDKLRHKFRY
jgi:Transglutaminase-like superfamily